MQQTTIIMTFWSDKQIVSPKEYMDVCHLNHVTMWANEKAA